MFGTRLVSGVILVVIALVIVLRGGSILFITTGMISLIGMIELYRILKIHKTPLGYVGYFTVILYYGILWFQGERFITLLVMSSLMVLMAIYVLTFPAYRSEQVMMAFFGVFYVGMMLSFLYQVRVMTDGLYLVWLVFLSSWGCDTCAYCVGVKFGRHKLAPKLSPKKSVEGAIGGVVGAALLGLLYGTVFGTKISEFINPQIGCMLACAIASMISQIGDLAASAIKRNHNIKDYGKLIPGHGGILDRFDSMLFTAPAIFFVVMFLR